MLGPVCEHCLSCNVTSVALSLMDSFQLLIVRLILEELDIHRIQVTAIACSKLVTSCTLQRRFVFKQLISERDQEAVHFVVSEPI